MLNGTLILAIVFASGDLKTINAVQTNQAANCATLALRLPTHSNEVAATLASTTKFERQQALRKYNLEKSEVGKRMLQTIEKLESVLATIESEIAKKPKCPNSNLN